MTEYQNSENFIFLKNHVDVSEVKILTFDEIKKFYDNLSPLGKSKFEQIIPDFMNIFPFTINFTLFFEIEICNDTFNGNKFYKAKITLNYVIEFIAFLFKFSKDKEKIKNYADKMSFMFLKENWENIKSEILEKHQDFTFTRYETPTVNKLYDISIFCMIFKYVVLFFIYTVMLGFLMCKLGSLMQQNGTFERYDFFKGYLFLE